MITLVVCSVDNDIQFIPVGLTGKIFFGNRAMPGKPIVRLHDCKMMG